MFSISFLDKLGLGRVLAVVIPAFIWGFGHSAYPNQPFYIRGLEVGLAGVLVGALMLRYGVVPLLVWHFTVDAIYTALLLLRSGNTYYVVSGAIASLILLLPLGVCLALYLRRGGFLPATGLSNGDAGFVPAPAARRARARGRPARASAVAPGARRDGSGRARSRLLAVSAGRKREARCRGPHGKGAGRRDRAPVPARQRRRSRGLALRNVSGHRICRRRDGARCPAAGVGRDSGLLERGRPLRDPEGRPGRVPETLGTSAAPGVLGRPLLPARAEGGVEGPRRRAARARRRVSQPRCRGRAGRAGARGGHGPAAGARGGGEARLSGRVLRRRRRGDAGPAEASRHDRRSGGEAAGSRGGAAEADGGFPRAAALVLPPDDSRPRELPAGGAAEDRGGLAPPGRPGRRHGRSRRRGRHSLSAERAAARGSNGGTSGSLSCGRARSPPSGSPTPHPRRCATTKPRSPSLSFGSAWASPSSSGSP